MPTDQMESTQIKKKGIRGWGIARRALAFRNYLHQLFKINMPGLAKSGGALRNHMQFRKDLKAYRELQAASVDSRVKRFPILREEISPYLRDMEMCAGSIGGDYFYQDIWAARKIHKRLPKEHVDIGSRIDGFITHLLVFMENVTVMDVRPAESNVPGLKFVEADCTTLKMLGDDSVDSISSLHAAEHFGLGRYGDPVDPEACFTFRLVESESCSTVSVFSIQTQLLNLFPHCNCWSFPAIQFQKVFSRKSKLRTGAILI